MRGQRAITESDFAQIPDVMQNATEIYRSEIDYEGKPAITFVKAEQNSRTTIVAVVSDKHLDLRVQTEYIHPQNKKGTLATPLGEQAPNNTPKASSGTDSTNSISQKPEDVNTKPENNSGERFAVAENGKADESGQNTSEEIESATIADKEDPELSARIQAIRKKTAEINRNLFEFREGPIYSLRRTAPEAFRKYGIKIEDVARISEIDEKIVGYQRSISTAKGAITRANNDIANLEKRLKKAKEGSSMKSLRGKLELKRDAIAEAERKIEWLSKKIQQREETRNEIKNPITVEQHMRLMLEAYDMLGRSYNESERKIFVKHVSDLLHGY